VPVAGHDENLHQCAFVKELRAIIIARSLEKRIKYNAFPSTARSLWLALL
jgi:hypothetical protein